MGWHHTENVIFHNKKYNPLEFIEQVRNLLYYFIV